MNKALSGEGTQNSRHPNNRHGHRGYIASRAVRGQVWPQHVQNLVVRDYAQRNDLHYLLSATEYAMEACYMNLEAVLEELGYDAETRAQLRENGVG